MSNERKPTTVMEKRAFAACAQIKAWDGAEFSVEWVRSRTWGNCPRIMWRGQKVAHASGCGYDKLSAVLVEFLTWLVPDDTLRGCSGAGVRTVVDRMKEAGWSLEQTYDGTREDGFRISRIEEGK